MKADSPPPPVVKFGMSIDETDRIVERHFAVMDEQHAIAGGVLGHNLRVAEIVHAKLHGTPAPEPLPCDAPMPVARPVVPDGRLDTVRSQLGLS